MQHKSNINIAETQHRIVIKLKKSETDRWEKLFSLFGRQTDFQRQHGISRQSVRRIIKCREGQTKTIHAIREYYNAQTAQLS
jgi:hypothetical protein